MADTTAIDLFLGLDLGKEFHYAHGRTGDGRTVHDKRLPNTEPRLLELFTRLVAKFGTVLVDVDQVANIGALPLTAARAAGCRVAYLPGLSMRRAADLHPGEAKTDARDAFVIAETARSLPHTLRAVDRDDETLAELTMLTGCAACSPRSIPPWSVCSTRAWPTPAFRPSCPGTALRPD